ncbi:hypothetical protein BU15DRAFT_61932 [Melanogaster broomeanus]|nr:hypothetical protein BU15DRAFT_61932 [Melanogaster broomeanus]
MRKETTGCDADVWYVPRFVSEEATRVRVWRRPANSSSVTFHSFGHLIVQEAPVELVYGYNVAYGTTGRHKLKLLQLFEYGQGGKARDPKGKQQLGGGEESEEADKEVDKADANFDPEPEADHHDIAVRKGYSPSNVINEKKILVTLQAENDQAPDSSSTTPTNVFRRVKLKSFWATVQTTPPRPQNAVEFSDDEDDRQSLHQTHQKRHMPLLGLCKGNAATGSCTDAQQSSIGNARLNCVDPFIGTFSQPLRSRSCKRCLWNSEVWILYSPHLWY